MIVMREVLPSHHSEQVASVDEGEGCSERPV